MMIKIPKDLSDKIIKECGVSNLILATGAGIASGAFIFTIVLSILLKGEN